MYFLESIVLEVLYMFYNLYLMCLVIMQVRVFDQPSDVGVAAGDIIKELLKETIKSSNRVTIGLSGIFI